MTVAPCESLLFSVSDAASHMMKCKLDFNVCKGLDRMKNNCQTRTLPGPHYYTVHDCLAFTAGPHCPTKHNNSNCVSTEQWMEVKCPTIR